MEKIKLNNGAEKAIKKLSKEYSKEYEDGKFADVYIIVLEIE